MCELVRVRVERIVDAAGTLAIGAAPTASVGTSSACGRASDRVDTRYVRKLRNLPACGHPVRVRLAVRRSFSWY